MSHTPGPWKVEFKNGATTIRGANNWPIAECWVHEDTNANYPLIAAAPELLAALEAAADDLECAIATFKEHGLQSHNEAGTLKRIRAAIAKARGQ